MTIAACLEHLWEASYTATALGVDAGGAVEIRETARQRLGFPADAYVMALAGGTGVGKSSLLNALAGSQVSAAGVTRPTTSEPVAWIPVSARSDLVPVLEWLGVHEIREHAGSDRVPMAIVDLPDLDSIASEHRARVDELLPRLDAVAWVADPEKYQDAILHDEYLRRWAPRLGRQAIVLNKVDRVSGQDADRLREDLSQRLRSEGLPELELLLSSARDGEAGIAELRGWLVSGREAKRIVVERLAAEARASALELAARAGLDPNAPEQPLIAADRRERAAREVSAEVLRILDLRGLERQAVAATRLAARPRGGGPMGAVTSFAYRWSGREQAAADPSGYLRRWRTRGSLAHASEPLRRLVREAMPAVPPQARPALAAIGEPGPVEQRLGEAIDRAITAPSMAFEPPRSRFWWLIGGGQFVVAALLAFAALWFIALWVAGDTSLATVQLPLLGPVPQPVLFLAVVLLIGYLLARLLGFHAGLVGRRWAARLGSSVTQAVEERLGSGVFQTLDSLEGSRARLGAAVRSVTIDCGAGNVAEPGTPSPGPS
ncbi:MAG: GTPase [Candidatus Limnocylindrales bacterium]